MIRNQHRNHLGWSGCENALTWLAEKSVLPAPKVEVLFSQCEFPALPREARDKKTEG